MTLVGNALRDAGAIEDGPVVQVTAKIVFFALTLTLFFSAIPLMVSLVLAGFTQWAGADRPIIRDLMARERLITLALRGICALGLTIALPAAIQGGFFAASELEGGSAGPPSQGVLVTRPGMSVAEMIRRSSLELKVGQTVIADGATFTLQIPASPYRAAVITSSATPRAIIPQRAPCRDRRRRCEPAKAAQR